LVIVFVFIIDYHFLCKGLRALVAVTLYWFPSLYIFRENFMKNIKKPPTADALYLDEGVGNE
jgi:hypothetical protein